MKVPNPLSDLYPSLFSYISYRSEHGGGFIFNPHLFNELWVDEIGFRIIRLSDGTRTTNQILDMIKREYGLVEHQAYAMLETRLKEYQSYYALKWSTEPNSEPGKVYPPQLKHHPVNYYSAPLSVLWDITYRCNMRCPHCLIDYSKGMIETGMSEAEHILDELKKNQVFNITFSGGEPLLHPNLLDILKKASEMNFGLRLSTNGLLLNRTLLNELLETGVFCLQVSLDGLKGTHDAFRGLDGSYEKAVEALKMSSDSGLHTTMSTMIIKRNLAEIPQILDLAVELGASSFKLNSFMPTGRGSTAEETLSVSKKELKELAEKLQEKNREYEDRISIEVDATYPWLLGEERSFQIRGTREVSLKCSAGYTNLVVSPDGTCYSCPYLTEYPLGNLLETPLTEIWNNNSGILGKFRSLTQSQLKGKCRECSHVPSRCNGGCRAASHVTSGDFYSEDPYCWKA
jgi:radical SAM protein with 4Fe4S-binding SPASM domain